MNYREMVDIKLPRAQRTIKDRGELYPVEVVGDDGRGRVKLHYVGYSSCHDEWRDESEVVPIESSQTEHSMEMDCSSITYIPFSLYTELGNRIKSSLMSRRKESPTIKIELSFDKVLFEGGLKVFGTESRYFRGVQRYKIAKYSDLNPVLGLNWHFCGINPHGDFCYVILSTVEYYLHKRAPLKEYFPTTDGSDSFTLRPRDLGYMLVLLEETEQRKNSDAILISSNVHV